MNLQLETGCRGHRADMRLGHWQIEKLARWARRHLVPDLPVEVCLPGMPLFERLDEKIVVVNKKPVRLTYEVGDLPSAVEAEARYDREENVFVVKLSEEIYQLLSDDHPRARVCLAHELGHIYLHGAQLQRMSRIPHTQAALLRTSMPPHSHQFDTEWQADSFAEALLMPAAALEKLHQAKENGLAATHVRAWFNVSPKVASSRCATFIKRRTELLTG